MKKLDAQTGDIIFFGADKAKVVNEALGALRIKSGRRPWAGQRRLGAVYG